MQLVASFATALSRAASGNNNRLSTLCKVTLQSIVVPKLSVPKPTRGTRYQIEKEAPDANQ